MEIRILSNEIEGPPFESMIGVLEHIQSPGMVSQARVLLSPSTCHDSPDTEDVCLVERTTAITTRFYDIEVSVIDEGCVSATTCRIAVIPDGHYETCDGCFDVPGWFDSAGDGCDWYERIDTRCEDYGDGFFNMGHIANTACCVCGGGRCHNADDLRDEYMLSTERNVISEITLDWDPLLDSGTFVSRPSPETYDQESCKRDMGGPKGFKKGDNPICAPKPSDSSLGSLSTNSEKQVLIDVTDSEDSIEPDDELDIEEPEQETKKQQNSKSNENLKQNIGVAFCSVAGVLLLSKVRSKISTSTRKSFDDSSIDDDYDVSDDDVEDNMEQIKEKVLKNKSGKVEYGSSDDGEESDTSDSSETSTDSINNGNQFVPMVRVRTNNLEIVMPNTEMSTKPFTTTITPNGCSRILDTNKESSEEEEVDPKQPPKQQQPITVRVISSKQSIVHKNQFYCDITDGLQTLKNVVVLHPIDQAVDQENLMTIHDWYMEDTDDDGRHHNKRIFVNQVQQVKK